VRGMQASMNGRPPIPWLRKHGFAVRLARCFVVVTLATILANPFAHSEYEITTNVIWVTNGIMLAYLLLAPRWHWLAYLSVGLAAMLAGNAVIAGRFLMTDLVGNGLNICEVLIGALLLRRRSAELPRFTQSGYLLRFLCFAVLAAPLAAGSGSALYAFFSLHAAPGHTILLWVVSDGMGTIVATPAIVALFLTRSRNSIDWQHYWIYPAILVGVTIGACAKAAFPLVFLIFPLLVLILLRLGLRWSTMALLYFAVAFDLLTLKGLGPFAAFAVFKSVDPVVLLEFFVVAGMIVLYSVSVVLEQEKTTERKLQKIVAQHALVTENSRDVIVLADFHGNRSYVSPAVQDLLGWSAEEVVNQGSYMLIHPDDLLKAQAAVRQLFSGAEGLLLESRIRKKNGEYIWIEASLRTVRHPTTGAPTGILNMVRDISERKQAEQKLQEAYKAVETLAITDALTGLANRRQFDLCITNEWRRGLRDRNPLAMLLIDVDLFKSYNDTYGHVRGDSCLKQIAEAALDVVARPGDLVARFGGEEFAVILPNTGCEGALQVANDICDGVRRRNLEHSTNPLGVLTISVGCASMVPSLGQQAINLIELADEALYTAKRNGRNQVCVGNAMASSAAAAPAVELSELSIAKSA